MSKQHDPNLMPT